MLTLHLWAQLSYEDDDITHKGKPLTAQGLESIVRPTSHYKCFVLSMIAFIIQILSGVSCAIDFVKVNGKLGEHNTTSFLTIPHDGIAAIFDLIFIILMLMVKRIFLMLLILVGYKYLNKIFD
eukprot:295262_1